MANLMDTLRLLKAGYTKQEILAMTEEKVNTQESEQEPAQTEGAVTTMEEQQKEDDANDVSEPDYKALYEQSQKDLKDAQTKNVNTNMDTGKVSSEKQIIEDAFRKFM